MGAGGLGPGGAPPPAVPGGWARSDGKSCAAAASKGFAACLRAPGLLGDPCASKDPAVPADGEAAAVQLEEGNTSKELGLIAAPRPPAGLCARAPPGAERDAKRDAVGEEGPLEAEAKLDEVAEAGAPPAEGMLAAAGLKGGGDGVPPRAELALAVAERGDGRAPGLGGRRLLREGDRSRWVLPRLAGALWAAEGAAGLPAAAAAPGSAQAATQSFPRRQDTGIMTTERTARRDCCAPDSDPQPVAAAVALTAGFHSCHSWHAHIRYLPSWQIITWDAASRVVSIDSPIEN